MILGVPRLGIYSQAVKEFFEGFGLNVVMPKKVTHSIIHSGVMQSSDFMCFPYKVTLGQEIWCLDNGATDLIFFSTEGLCRFKHYHQLQEITLKDMGYEFNMHALTMRNFIPKLMSITGASFWELIPKMLPILSQVTEVEDMTYKSNGNDIRIGLIGEFYTMVEPDINFDIVKKLQSMGVDVHLSITLSEFIKKAAFLDFFDKREEKQEAKELLTDELGGHGFHSIYNTAWYGKLGFDGVIHLMPLSCFVENTHIITEGFIPKKIKEIEVGDKVLTHKGRFRKVIQLLKREYQGEILTIDCGGMLNFKVTPTHPILALKRSNILCSHNLEKSAYSGLFTCRPYRLNQEYCQGSKCAKKYKMDFNPAFINANELVKGDFIAIPKCKEITKEEGISYSPTNSKKPKYKDISNLTYNKDILRLFGYYLAEGCLVYDCNYSGTKKYLTSVAFALGKKDRYIVDDIRDIVNRNFEASINEYSYWPTSITVVIYNRSFANIIETLCGSYCDRKQIHSSLMQLQPELQLEIVKGFFRGDGCLRDFYGETTYRGVTTSWLLANQLFWILIRNNIKASLSEQRIKNRKKSYVVTIGNAVGINRLSDKTISINHRGYKLRSIELEDYFLTPIREVFSEEFSGSVYNFEVEDDNSYIANNLTVHNCMPESTVEILVDRVASKYNIPIYRFPIDENNFEAGFSTRLETFISMIRRKRTRRKK